MHNREILQNWGPLASQNEFMGERINGMLQKFKTNDRVYDMDYTMLIKMARLQRLLAETHEGDSDTQRSTEMKTMDGILDSESRTTKSEKSKELTAVELAHFLAKKAKDISRPKYDLILAYLDAVRDHRLSFWGTRNADGSVTLPHTDHRNLIVPPRAKNLKRFKLDKRTFGCTSSHLGNSLIQFYEPGTARNDSGNLFTGVIYSISQIPLDGFLREFIFVRKHQPLDITPYSNHPELMAQVVYAEPVSDITVIEPKHIITHLTAWKRSANIYHTRVPVLVVCWALNRGRR
ncbi:hypothetical protein R3P38DRAFT_2602136 [Favolaschia claudopus]|uniref:Uncharacterized protein n=1 Tax=Favolaschia claudopus TaxID=2862362 RepID=A0AAW0DSH6_9AGAR